MAKVKKVKPKTASKKPKKKKKKTNVGTSSKKTTTRTRKVSKKKTFEIQDDDEKKLLQEIRKKPVDISFEDEESTIQYESSEDEEPYSEMEVFEDETEYLDEDSDDFRIYKKKKSKPKFFDDAPSYDDVDEISDYEIEETGSEW